MIEVKVYFDYVCPYCLVANENIHRFAAKYPAVHFDYSPWEIVPEAPVEGITLEYDSVDPRIARLAEEAGLWMRAPKIQPNSHMALLGFFYAKARGKEARYTDAVFDALWNHDENIGQLHSLSEVVGKIGLDPVEFRDQLATGRDSYEEILARSERDAVTDKIKLVPTFVFGQSQIIGNVSAKQIESFIKHALASREK
ncbi:MAG: DsbA family protein [Candidatus Atabeyarchaeum deiterrae]